MIKPQWLKFELPKNKEFFKLKKVLREKNLHTVCESARCPNIGYCFSQNTATFLLMGDICTRNCKFCAIKSGSPLPLDLDEPSKVAQLALELGLDYVVLTSVTRDDLIDGGAYHYKKTIEKIREKIENVKIEVLIPDFKANIESLKIIEESSPDVLNHNVEVPRTLYKKIGRPENFYERSLKVLKYFSEKNFIVKSGIMVGLGESYDDLFKTFDDLRKAGVLILTIGQYLQPTKKHLMVEKYYHPDEFEFLKEKALSSGILEVISAPLVRSSYMAKKAYEKVKNEILNIQ